MCEWGNGYWDVSHADFALEFVGSVVHLRHRLALASACQQCQCKSYF